ncbi:MAG: hypothetical protein GY842_03465 [bacterium]|nr:hypothetical protein [bacterium]
MRSIEDRLVALERTNRRYRHATMALGLILLAVASLGAGPGDFVRDVVRAKRFVVVDDTGHRLVEMLEHGGAGVVTTYDRNGKPLVVLSSEYGARGYSGAISTHNTPGDNLITLGLSESEHPVLAINGKANRTGVWMGISDTGHGVVSTHTEQGDELLVLGVTPGGQAALVAYDGKGHRLVEFGGTTAGAAGMNFLDRNGQRLVSLGVTNLGGSVLLNGGNGKPACSIGAAANGAGQIAMFDHEGKPHAIRPGP